MDWIWIENPFWWIVGLSPSDWIANPIHEISLSIKILYLLYMDRSKKLEQIHDSLDKYCYIQSIGRPLKLEISWIGLAIQSKGDNPTIHQNGFPIQIQSKKGLDFWIFSNPQSNPTNL